MKTRHFTISIALVLLLAGAGLGDETKTQHFRCTSSGTFADGVETNIDTNGDGASATLDQGFAKCNIGNSIFQEEVEWIFQPTLTDCPNVPGMLELHISQTQGQHRAVGTDLATGDQTFSQFISGTLCLNSLTGLLTTTAKGIYLGGTGKFAGATGTFASQASGSYLAAGSKGGVFGGFGQFTSTLTGTLTLPKGNGDEHGGD
jgi:hypothetical protein